jgi:hypothetical protein
MPYVYKGILETDELIKTENSLFDEAEGILSSEKANQFILTTDLAGIERYEKMFNIIADPVVENLKFRQDRIINRWSTLPPFTMPFLRKKLDEIIGVNKYKTYIDYSNYTLYIESMAENQSWYQEILITMNIIKPANIVFRNMPLIYDNINLSESINLSEVQYNYKLGTIWLLGQKPFMSYEEMGVVKLGQVSSVKNDFLNDLALFSASEIVKVLVNDTYEISVFDLKGTESDTAIINYTVPVSSGLQTITNIKLLNAGDKVLTSSDLYIQILDDVVLKHSIKFKEGIL